MGRRQRLDIRAEDFWSLEQSARGQTDSAGDSILTEQVQRRCRYDIDWGKAAPVREQAEPCQIEDVEIAQVEAVIALKVAQ